LPNSIILLCRTIALGLAGALLFAQARAADVSDASSATVARVTGEVREGGRQLGEGQRVASGGTITVGEGGRARLEFPDRQVVLLDQNTSLRIVEYQYAEGNTQKIEGDPRGSRARFDLLNGAARIITGSIGAQNPAAVSLRTAHANFIAYGTDFMVARGEPTVLSVLQGAVAAENGGGKVLFPHGSIGEVANPASVGVAIREQDLSPAARSAFARLLEAQQAAAAAPGAEAASSGMGSTTLILLGIGAAVLGAAGGGGGGGASTTSH